MNPQFINDNGIDGSTIIVAKLKVTLLGPGASQISESNISANSAFTSMPPNITYITDICGNDANNFPILRLGNTIHFGSGRVRNRWAYNKERQDKPLCTIPPPGFGLPPIIVDPTDPN